MNSLPMVGITFEGKSVEGLRTAFRVHASPSNRYLSVELFHFHGHFAHERYIESGCLKRKSEMTSSAKEIGLIDCRFALWLACQWDLYFGLLIPPFRLRPNPERYTSWTWILPSSIWRNRPSFIMRSMRPEGPTSGGRPPLKSFFKSTLARAFFIAARSMGTVNPANAGLTSSIQPISSMISWSRRAET